MTSDSKKFENAAANGEPFVCLTRIRDGKVITTLLIDGNIGSPLNGA